ncbi:MAG: hypothetical protein COB49_01870 [Alphaproteobacteria bacterium]|nr:MAG: hypothetical protein COB49_01870 [Alphaproteobacteria bacterium]
MSNALDTNFCWNAQAEACLIEMIEAGRRAREVCEALKRLVGDDPGRNAVIGKANRLARRGVLIKPLTPPKPRRSGRATAQWPVQKRDALIAAWNAGDRDEAQIAAVLSVSVGSVKKKLACLRAAGVRLRPAIKPKPRWSWPWDLPMDKKITAMINAGSKPGRIAAYLGLPTEAVQARVQAWNRRHEIAAAGQAPHPDPVIGADGRPGLTLLELPDIGACKFGTHLPDVDGLARFCGQPTHSDDVYCAAHHARAHLRRSGDARYGDPKIAKKNREVAA